MAIRVTEQKQLARSEVCRILDISPSTLRRWGRQRNSRVELRGRRVGGYPVEARNAVIAFLVHVTGPAVGVAALCCLFTDLPRCLLHDLLTRYRRVWKRRYRRNGLRLEWRVAGTVWAMDHSQPCYPINGIHPCLFAVRDLGSHCQLAWQGVPGPTAASTKAILEALFTEFGRPLVIKCDNGSAFIAHELVEWLRGLRIVLLYSPPRYPQYNGALERSNGVLKGYTQSQAIREGHDQCWTESNLSQAMTLANQISRPWGRRGPSPQEAWQNRMPVNDEQRRRFLERLELQRQIDRVELGLDPQADLSRDDQARLDRSAVTKVLVEQEYLTMSHVTRSAPKAKRRSKDEMRKRLEQNTDRVPIEPIDVSFLNVDSTNPPADLPCPTLPSTSLIEIPSQRAIALQPEPPATEVRVPEASLRAEATAMSNERSASMTCADQKLARECASEPLSRSTDTLAAGLAWVLLFVTHLIHWFDARTTAGRSSCGGKAVRDTIHKETLASAPRHDTMRGERDRDVGDPISSDTDLAPKSDQRDPADVTWLRRLFTPLVSKPKASKIT